MESRFKLIALTLMVFFCLGIVTGTWAQCILSISPVTTSTPTGGTVQFTVDCVSPEYTWEVSASSCTSEGTITETGLYTAPATGGCTETVKVTDTANGDLTAEATVKVCGEIVVLINCASTDLQDARTITCTAKTTCDGAEAASATYSWELDGVSVGTGSSYTFTCNESTAGSNTIKATDTSWSVSDTEIIICDGVCEIDVVQEQVPRSRWIPLPAILTILCNGDEACDFNAHTRINCEGDSPLDVIPVGRLVFQNAPTQTILQSVLIFPAILTSDFGEECETITCSVTNGGTCGDIDTFDICMLPSPLDLQR